MYKTLRYLSRGRVQFSQISTPKILEFSKYYTTAKIKTNNMENSPKLTADETAIVWMDLEMTGLNLITDKIIEVACLITDKDLNVLTEGLNFAIKYPEEVFEQMDEWCRTHHRESGLVKKCLESDITPEKAEGIVLEYLQRNVPNGKCPLAGSTIYMDRMFLRQHMPTVDAYMHYRIIDVSSVKELCRRWREDVLTLAPKKRFSHRSLDDIKESIDELKYYRQNFFKC